MVATLQRSTYLSALLVAVLVSNCLLVNAGSTRRTSSGSRKSSSSGSSSHRSTQHAPNSDHYRLSYPSSHSSNIQPSRQSTTNSHAPAAAPIGWNVPKQQTPVASAPPARPSSYQPSAPAPSSSNYRPAQNYYPQTPVQSRPVTNTNTAAMQNRNRFNSTGGGYGGGSSYRPRNNGTGGFGGGYGGGITPTRVNNVQSGNPTYHQPGQLPAGATYYPSGQVPSHATYYPSGQAPPRATYYPQNQVPPGATYYPSGQVPHGASYYPSGGPAHYPMQPAIPQGGSYIPAGAALPPNVVYMQQPPKSSGPGLGTGLIAGALGGAILGHALTPTNTRVIEHGGGYGGGMGGGGGGGNGNGEDKIIIINNGPPGSVSTQTAGAGTTVINTNPQQPAAANPPQYGPTNAEPQPPQMYPQLQPAAQPGAPVNPGAALAPIASLPSNDPLSVGTRMDVPPNAAAGAVPGAPAGVPAGGAPGVAPGAAPGAAPDAPPAGGFICVPVRMAEPDPQDPTKTIEVEKTACYPAPPAEPSTVAPPSQNATVSTGPTVPTNSPLAAVSLAPLNSGVGGASTAVPLASINPSTPINVPEGSVALAPMYPSQEPVLYRLPGETYATHRTIRSTMSWASDVTTNDTKLIKDGPNFEGVYHGMSGAERSSSTVLTTLIVALVAYYLY